MSYPESVQRTIGLQLVVNSTSVFPRWARLLMFNDWKWLDVSGGQHSPLDTHSADSGQSHAPPSLSLYSHTYLAVWKEWPDKYLIWLSNTTGDLFIQRTICKNHCPHNLRPACALHLVAVRIQTIKCAMLSFTSRIWHLVIQRYVRSTVHQINCGNGSKCNSFTSQLDDSVWHFQMDFHLIK